MSHYELRLKPPAFLFIPIRPFIHGQLVDHAGSWLHGFDDTRAGLIMPGTVLLGSTYYQVIAPDAGLDKAKVISINQTVNVPAGKFDGVI